MVTANLNANVRAEPSTDYEAVGSILQGGTAPVAGKNDAGTWWYIEYAGGHARIVASTTTSACIPDTLAVVGAAAPPEAPAVPAARGMPALIISEFSISPSTPVMGQPGHVHIQAHDQGNAVSGPYTVVWCGLSTGASPHCTWDVENSNPGGGRVLECDYTFASWYPVNKTSLAIVDTNVQVDESNEGHNEGTISPFVVAQP